MYSLIRCPGCRTFTYVDQFQRWKLCHVCGEAIDVAHAPVYLEVYDYQEAESIIAQMERYLTSSRKTDLSTEERESLRAQYARWVKNASGHQG